MNSDVSRLIADKLRLAQVPEYQEAAFTKVDSDLELHSTVKTWFTEGILRTPRGNLRVVVRSLTKAYAIGEIYGKDRPEYREKLISYFQREADIWARAGNHPNIAGIAGFMSTFRQDIFPALITPFFPLGDLRSCIMRKEIKITNTLRLQLLRDIACGLHYLHNLQPAIIHRDLRAVNMELLSVKLDLIQYVKSNILLDGSLPRLVARISDFGSAKLMDPTLNVVHQSTNNTSPQWYPPEWVKQKTLVKSYTNPKPSGDIWSFGCVFLEVWTGRDPWPKSSNVDEKISCGCIPTIPQQIESKRGYSAFLKRCWAYSPKSRPTSEGVIERLNQFIYAEESQASEATSLVQ